MRRSRKAVEQARRLEASLKGTYRWLQRAIIASAVLLLPATARPCQCTHIGSVAEEYPRAAAVFDGRVEKISRLESWWRHARRDVVLAVYDRFGWQPPGWMAEEARALLENGRYGLIVRFRVTAFWKGVNSNTVDVLTGFGQGDCGYPFVAGQEYRVWARMGAEGESLYQRAGLYTDMCTRTMEGFSSRLEELPPDKVHYPSE